MVRTLDDFYPRPPRGGRHCEPTTATAEPLFLSTPSARRATAVYFAVALVNYISIHALREEGDVTQVTKEPQKTYFYPRPPRGGRHSKLPTLSTEWMISIHALREEGDAVYFAVALVNYISIHALREEGDVTQVTKEPQKTYFYPRPPRGGRRQRATADSSSSNFYPRPPRGGRPDRRQKRHRWGKHHFYPRPPRGGRPKSATFIHRFF